MRISIATFCLFLALIAAVAAEAKTKSQTSPQVAPEGPVDESRPALIHSLNGAELYRAYCASCHGKTGRGDGPVAPELKAPAPDLTSITRTHGGEFPEVRIRGVIVGDGMIASHGGREMPVWGPIFHQTENGVDRGNARVEHLLKYLESIQSHDRSSEVDRKRLAGKNAPSGAQLYKQLCASCHGNDLKGNGPAPAPFKDVPPDLTTLARRHGGSFPDAYVSNVLRSGIPMPDHGPAEMPIWGADLRDGEQLSATQVSVQIANLVEYLKSLQLN
ncbi:MAG TPA: c-type cytochrome [Candidatus Cybelea sp.]|nr:c-type cytochrome [Candidatus Cybelea sp.]